jgi:RimJ/RimL family protein N-acetyltransferase
MTLQERPKLKIGCALVAPVIETARLTLRAPDASDAQAIASLINDRRIAENTARIPHPYSLADAQSFVATTAASGEVVFLITLRDGTQAGPQTGEQTGQIVGACGIVPGENQPPELGYWLGVEHWKHGYATEAAQALIDYAFNELEHDALVAGARVSNPASRRVLEKCGFQWTGVGLYRIRAIASSAPIDRFRLDRGIWASLKSWGGASTPVRRRCDA